MAKKTSFYLIGLVILIALGVYFVRGGFVSTSDSGSNFKSSGGIQDITLSFKNGNYYPNTITVQPNVPVRIRLDDSVRGCYRSFTVRSFGVSKYLATSSDYVEFTPDKEGVFGFACSMGMGTGKLVVGNVSPSQLTQSVTGNVVKGGGCSMGSNGGSCGCGG